MAPGTRSGGCVVGSTKVFPKNRDAAGIAIEDLYFNREFLYNFDIYADTSDKVLTVGKPQPLKGRFGFKAYPTSIVRFEPDPILEITFLVAEDHTKDPSETNGKKRIINTTFTHPFDIEIGGVGIVPASLLKKRRDVVFGIQDGCDSHNDETLLRKALVYDIRTVTPEPVYAFILGSKDTVDRLLAEPLNSDQISKLLWKRFAGDTSDLNNGKIEKLTENELREEFLDFLFGFSDGKESYRSIKESLNINKWNNLDLEDHFIYSDHVLSGDFMIQMALTNKLGKIDFEDIKDEL